MEGKTASTWVQLVTLHGHVCPSSSLLPLWNGLIFNRHVQSQWEIAAVENLKVTASLVWLFPVKLEMQCPDWSCKL
jgi:hypothetical protein